MSYLCKIYNITTIKHIYILFLKLNPSLKDRKRKIGSEESTQKLRTSNHSPVFDAAKLWFLKFIRHAEYMPDTGSRNLPSCLTKRAVYNLYRDEMRGRPLISRTTFLYNLWKKEFPWVVIPKVKVIYLSLQL